MRELRESPETVEEESERAEAPFYYGRGSGGRTEAMVEEGVRRGSALVGAALALIGFVPT